MALCATRPTDCVSGGAACVARGGCSHATKSTSLSTASSILLLHDERRAPARAPYGRLVTSRAGFCSR